jgi:hypothetical protein
MPDYQIFLLNEFRQVADPAIVVSCATDEEAIQDAHAYVDGVAVQVWDGTRLVGELQPKNRHSEGKI